MRKCDSCVSRTRAGKGEDCSCSGIYDAASGHELTRRYAEEGEANVLAVVVLGRVLQLGRRSVCNADADGTCREKKCLLCGGGGQLVWRVSRVWLQLSICR